LEEKYKDWFEGFSNAVSEKLGKRIRDEILDRCENCQKVSNDSEMAVCIKQVMERFDDTVKDESERYSIMENLGDRCVQYLLKDAEELKKKSNNIGEIVKNLNEKFGAELFKLVDKEIHSKLDRCFCHWGVKETKVPISITYCHCSLGWMKALFKTLLDKSIKVDLIQSVITGSDSCKFIIHLD
jgi:predicted hydrocarbon binding protein